MSERHKVFIVNRSTHDFSAAERFGELVFLSEGLLRKRNVAFMARKFDSILIDSEPEDYILPTSLTVMGIVAALMFARRHGRVNLLLFEEGKYKARTLMLEQGD